jgi:hypothetical protein
LRTVARGPWSVARTALLGGSGFGEDPLPFTEHGPRITDHRS